MGCVLNSVILAGVSLARHRCPWRQPHFDHLQVYTRTPLFMSPLDVTIRSQGIVYLRHTSGADPGSDVNCCSGTASRRRDRSASEVDPGTHYSASSTDWLYTLSSLSLPPFYILYISEECRLLGFKHPGDTLRLHYRVQPVNAM
jgi:hypothetical protein